MRRSLFILLTAVLIAPTGLMAQKVYKDGTKIILDMTVAAGMPADAVTDVKKYVGVTTAPASGTLLLGTGDVTNLPSGSINATVYEKLEIAPLDVNHATTDPTVLGAGTVMIWQNAFNRCKGLVYGDGVAGDWRLPTHRELMMMWIFRTKINDMATSSFVTADLYWSSTETGSDTAWGVSFGNGPMSLNLFKTSGSRVRCVREE